MIFKNRVLWLASSFTLSRAVIIALKASSFQNGSQIFWCFGVGNWSIMLFSRIIIIGDYWRIVTSTSSRWLFADIHVAFGDQLLIVKFISLLLQNHKISLVLEIMLIMLLSLFFSDPFVWNSVWETSRKWTTDPTFSKLTSVFTLKIIYGAQF